MFSEFYIRNDVDHSLMSKYASRSLSESILTRDIEFSSSPNEELIFFIGEYNNIFRYYTSCIIYEILTTQQYPTLPFSISLVEHHGERIRPIGNAIFEFVKSFFQPILMRKRMIPVVRLSVPHYYGDKTSILGTKIDFLYSDVLVEKISNPDALYFEKIYPNKIRELLQVV